MSIGASPGEVPTFYPTYDEFKDFSAFIASIEARGAHRVGLAKIVPPKEWQARRMGYKMKQIGNRIVENPIKQEVHGKDGVYSVFNIQQKSVNVNSFQKMAASNRHAPPSAIATDFEKLEKKYWQSLTSVPPIYGADVSGSLYDDDQQIWNVNSLGTILDDLTTEYGTRIQGVNTAYLYYGMWRASFAWHTEDMDLYSINFLHFGAPKQWYVIPPSFGRKFETFASQRFPSLARRCPAFLRHKMTIVSPSILTKHSIPYSKIIQHEGEFMITFPYGYHAGFNYGFNCAESTNFALERWIEYGKHSVRCTCREDMVQISMDRFVKKYQPEQYESWRQGIILTPHPEDTKGVSEKNIARRRSSMIVSTTIVDESIKNFTIQQQHQQRISDERYSSIFRNLVHFDKQNKSLIHRYPVPLVRAAIGRVLFKIQTNRRRTLLSIVGKKLSATSINGSDSKFFYGLKHAANYRHEILNGLWNFQSLDLVAERSINQYLTSQNLPCSICYLLSSNKIKENLLHISPFIIDQICSDSRQKDDEILQCAQCSVSVHRLCYDNVCVAMNVQLDKDEYEPWLCQRCSLRLDSTIDDRCSLCLLRIGLILFDDRHGTFQHAICSIYDAYQSQSERQVPCQYCWSFSPLGYRKISTNLYASCQYPKCSIRFHITCGLISGCTFSFDQKQQNFDTRCHLHASTSLPTTAPSLNRHRSVQIDESDDEQTSLTSTDDIVDEKDRIPTGTYVVVDEKLGQVMKNEVTYHYSVDFGDETFSHDMLSEDILDSTLTVGENIRVKWTDGTIYPCKYLGRKRVLLYHVKLDGEIRQLQRQEFSLDNRNQISPTKVHHSNSETTSVRSATKSKRDVDNEPVKRKRCRRILSSSSSSSSSDED